MTNHSSKCALPQQMTDVMSRLPINLKHALQLEGGLAIGVASITRASCDILMCHEWIDEHEKGEANTIPEFCPVAKFFQQCTVEARPTRSTELL